MANIKKNEPLILHGRNLAPPVRDIPVILPPPGIPYNGPPPTEKDMGKGDPDTIAYVNIKGNDIPSGHEERVREIEDMIDLTHQWLDVHSGIQTRMQLDKGTLPGDSSTASQMKRSDYRIKVVDTIMEQGNCPWINYSKDEFLTNSIRVKKTEFHTEIFKEMLKGLTSVSAISSALETALTSMSKIVLQSKNEKQGHSMWAFFNVFYWDDVTGDVKGAIRIIWYVITGDMVEYTVNKADYEDVKMGFAFHQSEFTFANSQWVSTKKSVMDFLEENGNKKVRDPIDGEVSV